MLNNIKAGDILIANKNCYDKLFPYIRDHMSEKRAIDFGNFLAEIPGKRVEVVDTSSKGGKMAVQIRLINYYVLLDDTHDNYICPVYYVPIWCLRKQRITDKNIDYAEHITYIKLYAKKRKEFTLDQIVRHIHKLLDDKIEDTKFINIEITRALRALTSIGYLYRDDEIYRYNKEGVI